MKRGLLMLLFVVLALPAHAATLVIVNVDGAGEGFNDNTAAAPVGGNPGTTIGQQRLNLFNYAADIWGALLPSDVTIRIQARFNPQSCDANSAVLGSAGPVSVDRDFIGAEIPGAWYHVALANKRAGVDLEPGEDDISATFNSSVDNNDACLTGTNWYYGFDGNEGGDIELLPVLLHEMGHGLGFSTLVSSSGSEFLGFSDVYETFLLDTTTGLHWDDMTNGQRAASSINTGNLVWDGYAATTAAPYVLGAAALCAVNSGGSLPATIEISPASFGPALSNPGVTGDLVLADDGSSPVTDACSALVNGAQIVGKIAVVDRGTCAFTIKALAAQDAGAIGVIVVNNAATAIFSMGGTDPGLTIPAVMVSLADGNAIKAEMGGSTVNMTLGTDPAQLAGADSAGRVKVYAPNPYEGGSSVSHWDTSATPSLLMEPAITGGLSADVDLTIRHFEDIGWLDERITASPTAGTVRTALRQNAPNPFNPITVIEFSLRQPGPVTLEVFDVKGRRVRSLISQDFEPGDHHVMWNGRDDRGQSVASGVYVYQLTTADAVLSKRMMLLK